MRARDRLVGIYQLAVVSDFDAWVLQNVGRERRVELIFRFVGREPSECIFQRREGHHGPRGGVAGRGRQLRNRARLQAVGIDFDIQSALVISVFEDRLPYRLLREGVEPQPALPLLAVHSATKR